MKKRVVGLLLSFLLICSIPITANAASSSDFTDVKPGEWYYKAVDHAASSGWFGGTTKTTFSPDTPMNRGMFVTVLGRFAKIPDTYTSTKPPFADVMENSYYAPYSAWASDLDVVSGVGNNRFAPNEQVSREQMAVLLFRYSMKSGITVAHNENIYNGFSDTNKVSSYAVDALKWATYYGIIKGSSGKINPQGKATRSEVAQIFMNFESFIVSPTPVTPTPEEPMPSPSPSPTPENPSMPWEDYDPQYVRKTGQSAKDADGGYFDYNLANEIMDQINILRVENGIEELEYHPLLQDWASVRAKEASILYSHTRPDGTICETVGYYINAENLACIGSKDFLDNGASAFITSWYNSDGHRQSMLSRAANLGSISCYVLDGRIYAAHLFSNKPLYLFDEII